MLPAHKTSGGPLPPPTNIRSVGPALSDRDKCNAQGSVQQLPKSPPLNTGQSRCSAVLRGRLDPSEFQWTPHHDRWSLGSSAQKAIGRKMSLGLGKC